MKNLTVTALTALLLPTAFAEDWPQWGGNDPGRNMYSPVKNVPLLTSALAMCRIYVLSSQAD